MRSHLPPTVRDVRFNVQPCAECVCKMARASKSHRARGKSAQRQPRTIKRTCKTPVKVNKQRNRYVAIYKRGPEQKAQQKAIYVEALAELGFVTPAAERAGIGYSTVTHWRHEDSEFDQACRVATEQFNDRIRDEVYRRGVEGVDKPVTYKGEITNTYKEYSDRCLEMLAKSRMKEFRDKVELTGEEGGPINVVTRVERVIIDPKKVGK